MCREGFQTGFLAGVIREACLREQETLESAVKFLPRPRQRGRSLLDHWLRPIPAKMAPFITGADIHSRYSPCDHDIADINALRFEFVCQQRHHFVLRRVRNRYAHRVPLHANRIELRIKESESSVSD